MADANVRTTPLPGVGDQLDFRTAGGETLGVIRHRDGDRELIVFSRDDPDACRLSVRLRAEDARTLAELLED